MSRRPDEFYFTELNIEERIARPTGYKLAPESGWLSKLLWWGLIKLKSLKAYSFKTKTYRWGEAENVKAAERVLEVARHVFDTADSANDYVFAMGARTLQDYIDFCAPNGGVVSAGPICYQEGVNMITMRGLEIAVLPYGDGFTVLPKRWLRGVAASMDDGVPTVREVESQLMPGMDPRDRIAPHERVFRRPDRIRNSFDPNRLP